MDIILAAMLVMNPFKADSSRRSLSPTKGKQTLFVESLAQL